ncbi:hypothetical protein [Streptomyces virginiae]|uniref:hypothetical protein n=1 Tax=Streptomyces virginiae TaxID=1961 RepID=UPI002255D34B|nr:hypothetical protein [Streptomyces virginiae]MCX5177308.1 hypothetical protein [Streptomyces virginiae]
MTLTSPNPGTSPNGELAAPRPRGGVVQSVNDSLVIAKRNVIRLSRIPNPLRPVGFQFNSLCTQGQRVNVGKGQVV